jgi:hypothetical protein
LPLPTVEIEETFEGSEWVDGGGWPVVTGDGSWEKSYSVSVHRDASVALSGTGCIRFGTAFYNDQLTLPVPTGLPVGVVFWARRIQSDSSPRLALYEWDGTTWRQTDYTTDVTSAEYVKVRLNVVLATTDSGQRVKIGAEEVYIDDIRLYTVPR